MLISAAFGDEIVGVGGFINISPGQIDAIMKFLVPRVQFIFFFGN